MKVGQVSVGETLSHARRTRGLSVDDVSADTRIRASLIASIEADNFAPCGGTVYARGHIRSIARVIGIDPEPVVHEFDLVHHIEPPPVATTVAAQATDPVLAARSGRRTPNWNVAMGLALVVICAVALIGLLGGHGSGAPKHPLSTGAAHQSATGNSATGNHAPAAKAPTTTTAQLPVQQASMLIRTLRGNCWLQIKSKTGLVLFSGTLPIGQHRLFTSKRGFSVIIGNAPAVDVVVNGHDIGSPPASGSVSQGDVSPGSSTIQQA
jgi:cytoskeletal protein RodZ